MSEHVGVQHSPSYMDGDGASGGGSNSAVTKLSIVAALGGFLFGYDSAVINGAVGAIEEHFDTSSAALGFAVASALLGAAAGALVAGRIADRFGRVRTMWVAAVLFFVSAIVTGIAGSLSVLVIGRIIGASAWAWLR